MERYLGGQPMKTLKIPAQELATAYGWGDAPKDAEP